MQLSDVEPFKQVVAFLETLGCLASRSHHYIDADEGIGHRLLYEVYLMGEQRRVVTAVHQPEHLIASALQRDVEMRHKGATSGTERYYLVSQKIWFYAADAISFDSLDIIQSPEQVDERVARCLAKVSDVHSRKHYLLAAFKRRLLCLLHQRTDRGVTAEATRIGNGAICAEIVAPVLHLEEISCAVAART